MTNGRFPVWVFGACFALGCSSEEPGSDPGGLGGSAGSTGGSANMTSLSAVSNFLPGELIEVSPDESTILTNEARAEATLPLANEASFEWAAFAAGSTVWRSGAVMSRATRLAYVDSAGPSFTFVDTLSGEMSSFLSEAESAMFSRFDMFSELRASESGELLAFCSGRRLFLKRGDEALEEVLLPVIDEVGGYHVMQVREDGSELLLGYYNAPRIDPRYLFVFDTTTLEQVPVVLEDASGAPLVETAFVSHLAMNDDFQKVIVVSLDTATPPAIVHLDLTTKEATPLFEGFAEHLASLGPEVPSIFDLESLSYRGSFATMVVNGYSDAAYWRGNKNAYVADVEAGTTHAFGIAPSDVDVLAAEADAASPGAAATYFPEAGGSVSGDGWQYLSARVTKSGDYAAYSALWSGGVSGLIVGPFTVVVPRSEWQDLD